MEVVFIGISFFVSRILSKLLVWFSQNLTERWSTWATTTEETIRFWR